MTKRYIGPTNPSDKQSNGISKSRRSVLQTLGVLGGGLAAVGGLGGTVSAKKSADVVSLTGSLKNPITKAEIEEQKRALREDTTPKPKFRTESIRSPTEVINEEEDTVEQEGDGKIVNFVYSISDDGVPQGYTGVAKKPADLKIVRKKAAKQRKRLQSGQNLDIGIQAEAEDNPLDLTSTTDSQSVSGPVQSNAVSSSASPTLVEIGRNAKDDYRNPYGGVVCNYIFYKLKDDGSSSRDTFAVQHTYAIDPGSRVYSDLLSEYYNDVADPIHNWKDSNLTSANLFDWQPLGNVSSGSTVGVSLGAGGPSVNWSYTSPGTQTVDRSQPNEEIATWRQSYRTSVFARTKLGGMKPGSIGQFQQPSTGSGRKNIFNLSSRAKFFDFITGILSSSWSTGYRPSYVY